MPFNPYQFLTSSVIPQSVIQPTQDSLTEPHLDQSPTMARIKGFGAGALQGLRDQLTPSNIAAAAMPALPGANPRFLGLAQKLLSRAPEAAEGASQAILGLSRALPGAEEAGAGMEGATSQVKNLMNMRDAEQMAAVRGSASDVPNNPVAQALEAARRSVSGPGAEAGRISSEALAGAGALGAAGAYGIPKLYNQAKDALSGFNHMVNPFQQFADTVNPVLDRMKGQ